MRDYKTSYKENMTNYLVDVPVQINIWIRPEMQRRQFEVIKKAKPSILFIISDGGRNEEEWQKIKYNRTIYDNEIDWECQVYKLYKQENNGLYAMLKEMHEFIWEKVDRCIFLEDDTIPSVSYFRFCAEMLEYYKDDKRVFMVCGVNQLGISENVNSDYFFSRYGAIQGTAMWKRSYDQFNDFDYKNDTYIMDLLKRKTGRNKEHWKEIDSVAKYGTYSGHVPADEFFFTFSNYGQNQVLIIPKKNLICNIGVGSDAEHGDSLKRLPKAIRQIYHMRTYELEFPLKHAKYMIPDEKYEKERNKILGVGHPFIRFLRKLERTWLVIYDLDLKYVIKKIRLIQQKKSGKIVEK